ncbi:MAG: winged helix-turn-helix transcriptional regulator [Methanobrevibacter sp.]|nr:winged helix-turn-helix transcriptional regulator [Methanobrevibacter sp.]
MKGNEENIFIYQYVEEMVSDFGKYVAESFDDNDISENEFTFLVRIRLKDKTTQKELVEIFKVSEGYTAKILRKFEDKGYITRIEDPENRRQKIVELTQKGLKKTDELISLIDGWESKVTSKLSDNEIKTMKKLLFKLLEE